MAHDTLIHSPPSVQPILPREPFTEQSMIEACQRMLDNTRTGFIFRNIFYLPDRAADLLFVARTRFATEIEVKTTRGNWREDLKKPKHRDLRCIERFYYAVPEHLASQPPEEMDPRYGIIVCSQRDNDPYLRAEILKKAKKMKADRISIKVMCGAFIRSYYDQSALHWRIQQLRAENRALEAKLADAG